MVDDSHRSSDTIQASSHLGQDMENKNDVSNTTSDRPNDQSLFRQYPAIVHAAVVSAFILPITLLPYLAARRQTGRLRQSVMRLERKTRVLQSALDLSGDQHSIMIGEVKRLQELSRNAVEATVTLRKEIMKQNAERQMMDDAVTTDLRRLLDNAQLRLPMHALGSSLADIAAFMQEVEIDFGMNPASGADRRGIDKLRDLARQLQNQPVHEPEDEELK